MKPSPAITRAASFCLFAAAMLVAIAGFCPDATAETAPMRAASPAAAPAHPKAPPASAATAAAALEKGKVLETMNAANYTYARVQTGGGEKWLAGPQTVLAVGDAVAWSSGSEMKEFTSKTLGRTFDSILFVNEFVVAAAAAGAGNASPHGSLGKAAEEGPAVSGVARAEGGLTVGEIYDRQADLEGKEVVVRGKVVKFNANVMSRNWIHLRDGSRSKNGDLDLTVTGDGQAAVGATVVARGKLVRNRDFGFNYRYDVMLEGAKVTAE